jgi:aspartate/methionine/tyrosine aminotransferase
MTQKTMTRTRSTERSRYMEFAKLRSGAKYNLATSGVINFPLADLPVKLEQLEINGPTTYGYQPLQERLAKKSGVAPECVVASQGTSMANHLALAALFEQGDEVLIEKPTYELILSAVRYLGAEIKRFPRRFENDFRADPKELAKHVTSKTKLIVLCNLHNPSSALIDEETMRQVGEIAASAGARVLVDEVYMEAVWDRPWRSSFHLGGNFVATTSLTKAYGLSGLRCGWILAQPDLAERMWRLNDLFAATPAHPAELLSVIALDNLEKPAARARMLLEQNRKALNAFLDSRDDLEVFRPGIGTTVFPRLKQGSVSELFRLLQDKYETSIVPGEYFEMPQHFRIGIGGEPEMTAIALSRLAAALDELHS